MDVAGATLATARGSDPSAQVAIFFANLTVFPQKYALLDGRGKWLSGYAVNSLASRLPHWLK